MRERNHFIGLWLNDEEYAHLQEQCEITGLPASVLIRHAIEGVRLKHRPPNEYAALNAFHGETDYRADNLHSIFGLL